MNSNHMGWSPFFEDQLASAPFVSVPIVSAREGGGLDALGASPFEQEKKLRPVTLARRTVNLGKEWGNQ